MLILIPYQIQIGFAIQRLISVFYEMAVRVTGDPARVHFGFTKVGNDRSSALPADFANTVEFDPVAPTRDAVDRLAAYVAAHQITSLLALDVPVEASYLAALRKVGVATIVDYWGAPISSENTGLKLLAKRVEVGLRRSKPDLFVFESEAMRTLAVRGRGIPRSATAVVYLGVDPAVFRPRPDLCDVVYVRFDIPRTRRIVVFMGHLHERKGVRVLMRAAGHVRRILKRDDLHFLFLGNREGEAEQFRDDYAAATGWITFGGYQSDVPALLAGCFLGCIPSTGWDSFTMSSIEMQACGLPIVVSDLHGLPETIVSGETGLTVRAGDHVLLAETIASMADDQLRRDAMGVAARNRVLAGFTREHQIDNLVRETTRALKASR